MSVKLIHRGNDFKVYTLKVVGKFYLVNVIPHSRGRVAAVLQQPVSTGWSAANSVFSGDTVAEAIAQATDYVKKYGRG